MLTQIEELSGGVRVLWMNNGENRFNRDFVDALNQALSALERDDSARAVVITGREEKYFSNGLDLAWIAGQQRPTLEPFLLDFSRLLHRFFTFPKPLVAAINGHAFAGGIFLACCADYRVMREDRGWLCVPEIDLGLDLPPGYVAILAHAVGDRKAELLSLTGWRLTGPEALAAGLADELAPADQVLPKAVEKARLLAAKSPRQYASHKLMLRRAPAGVMEQEDVPFVLAMLNRGK